MDGSGLSWNPQQQGALDRARRWLDAPVRAESQVFRMFGYAGVGKTTLARTLAQHAGPGVLAAAYTGKAAHVLTQKGLPAQTIHSLIYDPAGMDNRKEAALRLELSQLEQVQEAEPNPLTEQRIEALQHAIEKARASAQMRWTLKEYSDLADASLLILDEVSMVDEEVARDLLSFGVRVLCLGDPAQLPPVRGAGFFMDAEPDVLLTEVVRQAADNPILALATAAREGRSIPYGEWETAAGSARVVRRVGAESAQTADQIICGTNRKRQSINARMRQLKGMLGYDMPQPGERLICLRNDRERGLLNGQMWGVLDRDGPVWSPGDEAVDLWLQEEGSDRVEHLLVEAPGLLDEAQLSKWPLAAQMTWGYAVTVHKAQGSEWGRVLMFDDWPGSGEERQRWLYTGLTRAARELVLVRE